MLQFYHPPTKSVIDTAMYKLDESLIAGPPFGLPFDGGIHFHTYCASNNRIRPPTYAPEATVFFRKNNRYEQGTAITIPMMDDIIYTIQCSDGTMLQLPEDLLYPVNPDLPVTNTRLNTTPPWIHHGSKVTLYLHTMESPQHGQLLQDKNEWFFRRGNKETNLSKHLPEFESLIIAYI